MQAVRTSRIIINCYDYLSEADVLRAVAAVIGEGRISNNATQYCYATVLKTGVVVEATRRKDTDVFRVLRDPSPARDGS
jgi:hypothetical protein